MTSVAWLTEMSYGPQPPEWLTKRKSNEDEKEKSTVFYGPSIPTQKESFGDLCNKNKDDNDLEATCVYGPSFPSSSNKIEPKGDERDVDDNDDEEEEHFTTTLYGPSIPSSFRPNAESSLPKADECESDEDIGPMPVAKGNEEKEAVERAYRMVLQKEAEEDEKNSLPKREEWMTSVPKKLGAFGLGARTFKKGTVSERDSTWEDAPGAKKKRKEDTRSLKAAGIAAADARQEAIVAAKASGPSLLEIHQKNRKHEVAKESLTPGARLPFDREKDMEVRGLKPGGSKEAVDRMKEFTSRFTNSKEKRFL